MTIVAGYVPTQEGAAALDYAIAQAKKTNSLLVVINSSRGTALVDRNYASPEDVENVEERLAAEGIEHLVLQPVRGQDATDEVLDAAQTHNADLIIIGMRRRTPVGKLIMGSTAQRILLEADCPVIAVKAGWHANSSREV
ncbi:universal stress protein [Paenarthrobacter sp. NPDC090522]|uniref:universal stress protein n=1 Tax=Paenarthrobacter sp. NPDC090522 TaxID=3364383 RepID=UPI0037F9BED2